MAKIILAVLAVVVGVAVWMSCKCCNPPKPPHLDPHEWWGPEELKSKPDDSIRPFKIKFKTEMITDLKERIKHHRQWTPPLEGIAFEYGFNSDQLEGWLSHWSETYNFAEREKFFNQFPHFKTRIQGLKIHFIHVRPEVPAGVKVVPILLMHGWPGSVREFYEAIPLLTQQRKGYDFVFEVVVPSLPGYGFSEAAVRPGLGAPQTAVIMRNLMHRLGFEKYYIQGGDWGAVTASVMTVLYPEDILGHHTNMPVVRTGCSTIKTLIGALIPSLVVEPHLAERMYPLSKTFSYLLEETGYMHIQATKPDTVGVALNDSPAGLLAYILEKFSTWTVTENRNLRDGGLLNHFTKDQLLDNLMVYWSTSSITTSMRLYAETFSKQNRDLNLESIPTAVPTWALQAKYELTFQPANLLKSKFTNLVNATVLDQGGHFLAFQLPQIFVEDVFKAVKAFRELHAKNVKTEL